MKYFTFPLQGIDGFTFKAKNRDEAIQFIKDCTGIAKDKIKQVLKEDNEILLQSY